ncbi:hypothetical protein ABZ619_05540 [Streptomyces sp. NPDC007851]|uniref:hypothetical protein n=1 Tax=Streptomyces sp. NPDC007851 TaxID=3155008 RepID=UPI0033CD2D54
MSGRSKWIKAAAWSVVQWILTTVALRSIGLVINDFNSWRTCAALAAASIATAVLLDRWHRRRRRMKHLSSSGFEPEAGRTTGAPDRAGISGEPW